MSPEWRRCRCEADPLTNLPGTTRKRAGNPLMSYLSSRWVSARNDSLMTVVTFQTLLKNLDVVYTTSLLECSNNVIFSTRSRVKTIDGAQKSGVVNGERGYDCPVNLILPDRSSVCATEMRIETAW